MSSSVKMEYKDLFIMHGLYLISWSHGATRVLTSEIQEYLPV